jgi:hypothetical protein
MRVAQDRTDAGPRAQSAPRAIDLIELSGKAALATHGQLTTTLPRAKPANRGTRA